MSGTEPLTILHPLTLTIDQGQFVAIVGPSGSGKSTLINMMTGIDYPDTGSVIVHGQTINGMNDNALARWRGNNIGLIFQFFQLLPTLSALENVMLPMDFCNKWGANERKDRAMHCLSLVGMDRFHDRLPANMSGGQQQRVAIARALANDPPIIIGDEPTGNLDSATAQQIFQLLGQLAQSGKTVAFVTHDPLLARSTPRKIEILDGQVLEATGMGDGNPLARA
jgi:putative ABC transport system ATP-binding protein